MLKIALLFFFIPIISKTQNLFFKIAKDSDAIALSYNKVSELKISKLSFTEPKDSNQFIGYPANNAKYIIHNVYYDNKGVTTQYDWSFTDNKFPQINENEKQQGAFYITNDYYFEYENEQLKNINVSDASQIFKISYNYSNDSIFEEINVVTKCSKNEIIKNSFNLNFKNIIYSNTGIKQIFFPNIQIINLHNVKNNTIFINNIPILSYFDKIFENNRFLIEICPYKWILFNITE